MITLYSKDSNTKLAYLNDIIIEDTIEITRKINGEFILRFEVLEDNLKCGYFESENYIAVDKFYFDIVYIEQIHSDSVTYRIECEHITYRLIEDEKEFYTYDGTPTQILSDILTDTDFTVGTVEPTTITTFAVYEETNKLRLLQLLAYHTNSELDFDGFKISLKNTLGQDLGFQARFGKNLTGVKKIIDRRKGLTYYAVDIVELRNHPSFKGFEELEVIEEGDTIRIIDEVIGLDVSNKVIKRTYNPVRLLNTSLEIANSIEILTDTVTKIRRDTVAKDKIYHGIRISPDSGFESLRSDKMARGIFNSDIFALQTGDGTGENWVNKLYFDPTSGRYIFDGMLSATMIEALEAEFDVSISNSSITQTLAAETAYIAQLTVDHLETSTKVQNYLQNNTSDVNYIRVYEQYIQFITASTDGSTTEQVKDRHNNNLYWIEDTFKGTTTNVTDYPVMIYEYNELIKSQFAFIHDGINYTPQLILGTGTGNTEHSGKTFLYKATDGFYIDYRHSVTGESTIFKITDDGIDLSMFPNIIYSENVVTNVPRIWVQQDIPSFAKPKDVWIDTDDYSRYDVSILGASTTLLITDNEVIRVVSASNISITLHSATSTGVVKCIKNAGTGIVTIIGSIDGKTNMSLYPNESVTLITNGTSWDAY